MKMKMIIVTVLAIVLASSLCFGAEGPKEPTSQEAVKEPLVLKTETDKISYAVGVDTARNFLWSKVELSNSDFLMGLRDVFTGNKILLTESEFREAMKIYQDQMGESEKVKVLPRHVSYAAGVDMAKKLKPLGVEFNLDALERGFRDIFSNKELLLKGMTLRYYINSFQLEIKQRRAQARVKAAKETGDTRTSGAPSLIGNKATSGMIKMPSGLGYKILKEGTGLRPTEVETVEVDFRGTFTNGEEFESSYRTGKSVTLEVGKAIPGWKEALTLMPVGSKWLLTVPPELAYGEKGKPPLIRPNTTLIFELELLSIKQAK
jgi:FKBP-type peptidyl-prolyl cis-trans isomerase